MAERWEDGIIGYPLGGLKCLCIDIPDHPSPPGLNSIISAKSRLLPEDAIDPHGGFSGHRLLGARDSSLRNEARAGITIFGYCISPCLQ